MSRSKASEVKWHAHHPPYRYWLEAWVLGQQCRPEIDCTCWRRPGEESESLEVQHTDSRLIAVNGTVRRREREETHEGEQVNRGQPSPIVAVLILIMDGARSQVRCQRGSCRQMGVGTPIKCAEVEVFSSRWVGWGEARIFSRPRESIPTTSSMA